MVTVRVWLGDSAEAVRARARARVRARGSLIADRSTVPLSLPLTLTLTLTSSLTGSLRVYRSHGL